MGCFFLADLCILVFRTYQVSVYRKSLPDMVISWKKGTHWDWALGKNHTVDCVKIGMCKRSNGLDSPQIIQVHESINWCRGKKTHIVINKNWSYLLLMIKQLFLTNPRIGLVWCFNWAVKIKIAPNNYFTRFCACNYSMLFFVTNYCSDSCLVEI